MQDMGYETLLVTGQVGTGEGDMSYLAEAEGVKPVFLSKLGRRLQPLNDLIAFIRILRVFLAFRPDIVHTHTAKAGALGRLVALIYNAAKSLKMKVESWVERLSDEGAIHSELPIPNRGCKIVHTFHGHILRGYFSPFKSKVFQLIEKMLARFTDAIVAVSEQQKDEMCTKFAIGQPEQYRVIHLGFNLSSFAQDCSSKGKLRSNLGLSENGDTLVGIIGRLTPIKNHRLFLEAVRLLAIEKGHTRARFLIVGDGELRKDLEEMTKRLDLADQVIFTGWIRDLPSLYADLDILALTDLDILALTSNNEGTPVAVIEAMAAGVPVVATDVGGVRELIADCGLRIAELNEGEFGICERGVLVARGDVKGFAKGLHYLLEHPDVCTEMGRRGRQYAMEKHTAERLVSDMDKLYQSLLIRNDKYI
jgi:glycosyltransferase involved in cell wall biosynthesis